MKGKNFKDLIVWQKSMDLVEMIYKESANFPREEVYGLTNQIRRASVSIPSNVAEGQSRNSSKQFLYFLAIARGSNSEVQTQILIAERLNYVSKEMSEKIVNLSTEIAKMINGLMKSISG